MPTSYRRSRQSSAATTFQTLVATIIVLAIALYCWSVHTKRVCELRERSDPSCRAVPLHQSVTLRTGTRSRRGRVLSWSVADATRDFCHLIKNAGGSR